MDKPLVAVPTDIRNFDNYLWHGVPQPYLNAAADVARVTPLEVPSLGADRIDLNAILQAVDGVMITGSKSNVHPSLYGEEATEANGPYDPGRDATSIPMIKLAIELGIPLLCICRGIQELNVALGGTLATEIQEREDILDHRAVTSESQDERFAVHQAITIREGSCMAEILGAGDVTVNSLHRQAIGSVAPGLAIEALAPDGIVEAVSVKNAKAFAVGVQWHPEYWAASDQPSKRIFSAFGDAVRAHALARNTGSIAAE
ncbi:MAG: gamma-glutamyl-gamma-aminobutyrate hydrolase family protein [Rhizobiaceae bacterium]